MLGAQPDKTGLEQVHMAIKPPPHPRSSQLNLPLSGQGENTEHSPFSESRTAAMGLLLDRIWWSKGMRCLEIGCGTGRACHALHHRLQASLTLGIDSDAEKIRVAKAGQDQVVQFRALDASIWSPEDPFDLVLIQAPQIDIPGLRERLSLARKCLDAEGQLVVHLPKDRESPLARQLLRLSQKKEFSDLFFPLPDAPAIELLDLSEELQQLGFLTQRVDTQVIPGRMGSPALILQWLMEFALPPLKAAPDSEVSQEFLSQALEIVQSDRGLTRPTFWPTSHVLAWARLP
jgi:trans-aconitate methyltransferase